MHLINAPLTVGMPLSLEPSINSTIGAWKQITKMLE